LRAALKTNPALLTSYILLELKAGRLETIPRSVSPYLDILLPEVFRAFATTNHSQYIDIMLPGTHVALTCFAPGLVQVQHLTATPVFIDTFQLDRDGNVVKV
jgi:hypothetical protein